MRVWVPFLAGFAALFVLLNVVAGWFGVLALLAVLAGALVVERLLGVRWGEGLRLLGFGRPRVGPLVTALAVGALVQLVYPAVAALTGAAPQLRSGWGWLLLSVFAFHGLAEELVWRGYAYRRLREGRSFKRAVLLTMPLVAATHIPIVITSGLAVGVAAMIVAAVTVWPFAHLFEAGGHTIWAPAVLHAAIDTFKLFTIPDAAFPLFPLLLAGVSVFVPLLALLYRDRRQ